MKGPKRLVSVFAMLAIRLPQEIESRLQALATAILFLIRSALHPVENASTNEGNNRTVHRDSSAAFVSGRTMKMRRTISAVICMACMGLVSTASVTVAADSPPDVYLGPKKTVFVDVVGAAEAMAGGTQVVGTTNEGLNAMLVDALIRNGRFVVVERVALGAIQLEQQLGQGGATTAETAAVSGQMLGASAIVRATVTKFESAAGGGGLQMGLPFGRLMSGTAGVTGQHAMVEFNLRIIDTSTGQVVATFKASGTASSTSANVSAINNKSGANVGTTAFQNTPLGEAAESAINTAVKQIALGMENVRWSALVVAFDDGKVYVSAGAAQNLKAGAALHVYRKGKVLTDPATGMVLETLMTDVGTIQIQSVNDKVSIGTVTSGDPPARGDLVKFD
jgi:curli biogenesis system outer membrane secretion channel CsgG